MRDSARGLWLCLPAIREQSRFPNRIVGRRASQDFSGFAVSDTSENLRDQTIPDHLQRCPEWEGEAVRERCRTRNVLPNTVSYYYCSTNWPHNPTI